MSITTWLLLALLALALTEILGKRGEIKVLNQHVEYLTQVIERLRE